MSNSVRPHRWPPTRLPRPWDSPGKNTGVGCHFLLQCMKVESESEVAQSCLTFSDPMDCSLPGSSLHGIFQARVLAWSAIAFSEWDNNSPLFSSISPSNSQQFPVGTGAEMTSPSHYPLLKLGLYQNMSSALFSREFNLYTGINDDSF